MISIKGSILTSFTKSILHLVHMLLRLLNTLEKSLLITPCSETNAKFKPRVYIVNPLSLLLLLISELIIRFGYLLRSRNQADLVHSVFRIELLRRKRNNSIGCITNIAIITILIVIN